MAVPSCEFREAAHAFFTVWLRLSLMPWRARMSLHENTGARLDALVHVGVSFVKVDAEGHELNVLRGARVLIERSRPVFLVEEERHRTGATESLFNFFTERAYDGFFLRRLARA